MYYIVLYCIILYCIVLYCIVLYCIVLYCIVLYCIILYCIILYYINLIVLNYPGNPGKFSPQCLLPRAARAQSVGDFLLATAFFIGNSKTSAREKHAPRNYTARAELCRLVFVSNAKRFISAKYF